MKLGFKLDASETKACTFHHSDVAHWSVSGSWDMLSSLFHVARVSPFPWSPDPGTEHSRREAEAVLCPKGSGSILVFTARSL